MGLIQVGLVSSALLYKRGEHLGYPLFTPFARTNDARYGPIATWIDQHLNTVLTVKHE